MTREFLNDNERAKTEAANEYEGNRQRIES